MLNEAQNLTLLFSHSNGTVPCLRQTVVYPHLYIDFTCNWLVNEFAPIWFEHNIRIDSFKPSSDQRFLTQQGHFKSILNWNRLWRSQLSEPNHCCLNQAVWLCCLRLFSWKTPGMPILSSMAVDIKSFSVHTLIRKNVKDHRWYLIVQIDVNLFHWTVTHKVPQTTFPNQQPSLKQNIKLEDII